MSTPPTLLALRALGLGDLLTGVPALRALATAFPDHRRLLLAPRVAAELLELVPGSSPVVHGVVATDFTRTVGEIDATAPVEWLTRGHPDGRSAAGHGASRERTVPVGPHIAVNLHGRGPESHRRLQALGPRRLIAFDAPTVGHRGATWDPDEHEVRRWCRLLEESGIPTDPTALRIEPPSIPLPARAAGATLLHPGAAAPARRWPVERWVAVARAARDEGRGVVLTGGPSEVGLARDIAAGAGLADDAVLAGATSLRTLTAVVAAAAAVVCGDTGVAHLATAVGTPSVLLFGPTPPARWGPLIDDACHIVLWTGRRGDPHADHPDPGLLEIGSDAVVDALGSLRRRTVS